jgi:hypothetical protein
LSTASRAAGVFIDSGRKLGTQGLPHAILLHPPSLIELLHGDLRVTDTGQIGARAGVADVRVDAPEGKGKVIRARNIWTTLLLLRTASKNMVVAR